MKSMLGTGTTKISRYGPKPKSHVWCVETSTPACGTKYWSSSHFVVQSPDSTTPLVWFYAEGNSPSCKKCFKEFFENMPIPLLPGVFPRIKPCYKDLIGHS